MNWILKNKKSPCRIAKNKNISQGKKIKALFVALFLVFVFSFFTTSDAKAAGTCQCSNFDGAFKRTPVGDQFSAASDQECNTACAGKGTNRYCYSSLGPCLADSAVGNKSTATATNVSQAAQIAEPLTNLFVVGIKWILVKMLALVGWLFAIASTLFAWAVNPANISAPATGILQKQAVKDVWIMVRDLLNMAFILVLLFSAFGTIFQIDKWNIKNVWLQILIQALLVNFSYPIARFIIDLSNVAFYYLLNNLFTSTGTTIVSGDSIFAMFGSSSGISNLLSPESYAKYDISYLIAMIMVVFIMGMTLFVVAVLFVVRLIALAMLVMFSPIGFVGYAVPSLSKYAGQWWENLFSYSFFAPVMIFFMAVSLRVTQSIQGENFPSLLSGASANAPADQATWIANAALFAIPVIMLWMGMGIAKKFGIEGAEKAVGWAKKGKDMAVWTAFKNPVARGVKEGVKERTPYNRVVKWWKDPSNLEAAIKGTISNSYKKDKKGPITEWKNAWNKSAGKTISDANKKKIAENVQDHIDSGKTAAALIADLNSHAEKKDDRIKQASAAQAYLRMDNSEKKDHFDRAITYNAVAGDYGEFNHILTASAHPDITDATKRAEFERDRNAARAAADNLKVNPNNKRARNTLSTFITRQLRENVTRGTKAK